MKKLTAKLISFTTAAAMLLVSPTAQVFSAGRAKGDDYNISGLDLSKAKNKPNITISKEIISYEETKINPIRTVNVDIVGAQNAYANGGFTVRFDDRLTLIKDEDGEIATYGRALRSCHTVFQHDTDYGFRAIFTASRNAGKDGTMFSFDVQLPDDIDPEGEIFPIDIYYNKNTDLFTNIDADKEGQLMEAWVFRNGIEQGYIEVLPQEETTTTTTTTAPVTTTTAQPIGDTNNDGRIDSVDASKILKMFAYISTGGEIEDLLFSVLDVNCDNKIDSLDASTVLAYYVFNTLHDDAMSFLEYLRYTDII